jgi:phosphotransferase system IIB component
MQDLFLNIDIYDAVLYLCRLYSITKLTELKLSVHKDSQITKESVLELFASKNSSIVGDWTQIVVEKNETEKLKVKIDHIYGERNPEF